MIKRRGKAEGRGGTGRKEDVVERERASKAICGDVHAARRLGRAARGPKTGASVGIRRTRTFGLARAAGRKSMGALIDASRGARAWAGTTWAEQKTGQQTGMGGEGGGRGMEEGATAGAGGIGCGRESGVWVSDSACRRPCMRTRWTYPMINEGKSNICAQEAVKKGGQQPAGGVWEAGERAAQTHVAPDAEAGRARDGPAGRREQRAQQVERRRRPVERAARKVVVELDDAGKKRGSERRVVSVRRTSPGRGGRRGGTTHLCFSINSQQKQPFQPSSPNLPSPPATPPRSPSGRSSVSRNTSSCWDHSVRMQNSAPTARISPVRRQMAVGVPVIGRSVVVRSRRARWSANSRNRVSSCVWCALRRVVGTRRRVSGAVRGEPGSRASEGEGDARRRQDLGPELGDALDDFERVGLAKLVLDVADEAPVRPAVARRERVRVVRARLHVRRTRASASGRPTNEEAEGGRTANPRRPFSSPWSQCPPRPLGPCSPSRSSTLGTSSRPLPLPSSPP